MLDEEYNACSSALYNFIHSPEILSRSAPNIFLSIYSPTILNLIVPSANSVSPLEIAAENRFIHASHENCIVYLFL